MKCHQIFHLSYPSSKEMEERRGATVLEVDHRNYCPLNQTCRRKIFNKLGLILIYSVNWELKLDQGGLVRLGIMKTSGVSMILNW